jgi:hypothetical protein
MNAALEDAVAGSVYHGKHAQVRRKRRVKLGFKRLERLAKPKASKVKLGADGSGGGRKVERGGGGLKRGRRRGKN